MDALLARITPGHVASFARIGALLIAFALTAGYVTDRLTLELAGVGAFFLSVLLLLALPNQRSSELLGALAIWLTYAEFMAAIQSGHFDLWRWAVVLATLAVMAFVVVTVGTEDRAPEYRVVLPPFTPGRVGANE
jgi:hypothetical protein